MTTGFQLGNGQDSGSNFNPQAMMEMMRIMEPERFEEPLEAIWADGVTCGTRRTKEGVTAGVISLMVVKPTTLKPKASLVITTSGQIDAQPEVLGQIGEFFTRLAKSKDVNNALEEAQKGEAQAQQNKAIQQAANLKG